MSSLTLTILGVMTFPRRSGVLATVEVQPATSVISGSATFRHPTGGRWRVSEIANSDPPPPRGRLMVTLSPVGDQGTLTEGMKLEQER
jgi:hypothetical protein